MRWDESGDTEYQICLAAAIEHIEGTIVNWRPTALSSKIIWTNLQTTRKVLQFADIFGDFLTEEPFAMIGRFGNHLDFAWRPSCWNKAYWILKFTNMMGHESGNRYWNHQGPVFITIGPMHRRIVPTSTIDIVLGMVIPKGNWHCMSEFDGIWLIVRQWRSDILVILFQTTQELFRLRRNQVIDCVLWNHALFFC